MEPITMMLGLASMSGAIVQAFGPSGPVEISQAWLDENFGDEAWSKEFNKQLRMLQSSPQGQAMFNRAANMGQQLANQMRSGATAAGFGGAEGVQAGSSIFATSVADQAGAGLRQLADIELGKQAYETTRSTMQNKWNTLLPNQMQRKTSPWQKIGMLLGPAAALALAYHTSKPSGGGDSGGGDSGGGDSGGGDSGGGGDSSSTTTTGTQEATALSPTTPPAVNQNYTPPVRNNYYNEQTFSPTGRVNARSRNTNAYRTRGFNPYAD